MERIVQTGLSRPLNRVIYRIGATMYRDPGFEQCAHHTLLWGACVNTGKPQLAGSE